MKYTIQIIKMDLLLYNYIVRYIARRKPLLVNGPEMLVNGPEIRSGYRAFS